MMTLTNKVVSFLVLATSVTAFAQAPTLQSQCGTSQGFNDYAYQQCASNYNRTYGTYNSGSMSGTTSTGVKPPNPPNYSQCDRTDPTTQAVTRDQVCVQGLERNYQLAMDNYNKIKQAEEAAKQAQMAQAKQYESAKAAAEAAQRENDKAQKNYQLRQTLCTVTSAALMAVYSACVGTCWPALAGSIAMGIYAGISGGQANRHANSEYISCQTANKISTNPADCGPAPGPFDPSAFPANTEPAISTVIDPTGKCIATPELCKEIETNLPAGTSLKDVAKGLNLFAGGKSPFKIDKDGKAVLNNGKKLGADQFDSYDKLIAAGMSPAQAKMIMDQMNKNSELAKAFDAKGALGAENGEGGLADADGSGKNGSGAGGAGNGDGSGNSLDAGGKRSLASAEGLVKDFNGESIGVAGDDIWKMMNRRYRLKDNQDSFVKSKP